MPEAKLTCLVRPACGDARSMLLFASWLLSSGPSTHGRSPDEKLDVHFFADAFDVQKVPKTLIFGKRGFSASQKLNTKIKDFVRKGPENHLNMHK